MITMRTLRKLKKVGDVYTLKYIKGYTISIDDDKKTVTFDGPSYSSLSEEQVPEIANINVKNKYALVKILAKVLKSIAL